MRQRNKTKPSPEYPLHHHENLSNKIGEKNLGKEHEFRKDFNARTVCGLFEKKG